MSRLTTSNAVTRITVAAILVSLLLLQATLPTIAYAVTTSEEGGDDTISEEVLSPPILTEPEETTEEETYPESLTGDVTVETGDATAGLLLETEVNTTEVDTTPPPSAENEEPAMADQEPLTLPESGSTEDNVETTLIATTTTNATSAATTGDNTASGGSSSITTGNAVAYADVLNVVNTNIVNSDGLISFINDTLGYTDFDLRPNFELTFAEFDTALTTNNCLDPVCSAGFLSLYSNTSTADINNSIVVTADTGGNAAFGGEVSIDTGSAYASANIINVANTNITDSHYLLLVFNNFSDYTGDIVLPNSDFFDTLLATPGGMVGNANLTNQATVENDLTVVANTGDNSALGDNTVINTGNSVATSNTTNLINQNILGGSTFSMLIRVHGTWTGTIAGLPDGMTWRETERGIEIIGNSVGGSPINTSVVSSNNQANIKNDVQVYALTGDNEAIGEEIEITTGDAYADASIMNIANTNIIGSNWSNLIFTIYGNWNGSLTFGQPDLWLGVSAHSEDQPIMPGSLVTYTYTIFNSGDTTAPNVTLESLFPGQTLSFPLSTSHHTNGSNTMHQWSLGNIRAGETKEFSYTARVNKDMRGDVVTALPLTSRVSSTQKDADSSDNEDVVTIYVGEKRKETNSARKTFPAHFDITKTASRDLAQPGDTVDYTVTFFNRGGQLFDALLVDTLENEAGEVVEQQSWPLGEIKNWETITIHYKMDFDSDMTPGKYTNYAQLVGFHESLKERYQKPYESPLVSHTLSLGDFPDGEVLGISDTNCPAYLTKYMRYGANNDPTEVQKLQTFLNTELGRSLAVSGYFDRATEQAVRDFQIIHRDEILIPWGLTRDSGYVYYTTQKKINEIMCGGMKNFPLAATQLDEINTFRTRHDGQSRTIILSPFISEPAKPEAILPKVVTPQSGKETSGEGNTRPAGNTEASGVAPLILNKQGAWNSIESWWNRLIVDPLYLLRR